MKQIVIFLTIIALTTLSINTSAQNIQGSYQLKADGQVKKQQVECQKWEATGQGIVWDFSEMELPDDEYVVDYSAAADTTADNLVAGTEQRTRSYYRSTPDSVVLCGYENNLSRVEYDRPELMLHMPLSYGSRHDGLFHGTMTYCERMFLRVCGSCMVEVDGTGSMLLPSGDTLRHVSRVHVRKLTSQRHYPLIMTEQELKMYVDSIAPYTADSIRLHLTTDTLLTETNTYRWYATGYRYPILEYTAIGHQNATPYYTAAYYCSPEEQQLLSDEENETTRRLLADADRQRAEGSNGADGGNSNGSPGNLAAQNMDISVSASTISVSYDLTADATVTALVCDVSGIVYRQQSQKGQAGDSCQLSINCGGLHHGQYVLYLNVNGQVISQTVSL